MTGCGQSFVREDLFLRHRSRHQRGSELVEPKDQTEHVSDTQHSDGFKIPLSPEATATVPTTQAHRATKTAMGLPPDQASGTAPVAEQLLPPEHGPLAQSSAFNATENMDPKLVEINDPAALSAENFASWLFGSPDSQDPSFNPNGLPFFDSGIDWSSWDFSDTSFPLETIPDATRPGLGAADLNLSDSLKQVPHSPDYLHITTERYTELCEIIDRYKAQRRSREHSRRRVCPATRSTDADELGDATVPELSAEVLQGCVASYWDHVAEQMPIVHRSTFSCSDGPCLLLLAMITLGAGHLAIASPKGSLKTYSNLGNMLATGLRWEIFEDPDAHPPVKLWVAQALVLLEFYEKMYATRLLHERAHIGHSYTLNLLRRGSPMVAASGSASPRDEDTETATRFHGGRPTESKAGELHEWWVRWARNESMHRVVFAAFKMDILHAVMFGRCCVAISYLRALTIIRP